MVCLSDLKLNAAKETLFCTFEMSVLLKFLLCLVLGLCCQDILLSKLWTLMGCLGHLHGLRVFLEALSGKFNTTAHPLFNLLRLSCDASHHILMLALVLLDLLKWL